VLGAASGTLLHKLHRGAAPQNLELAEHPLEHLQEFSTLFFPKTMEFSYLPKIIGMNK
jgi:hypothetical protein